jgi:hypothetical protein
MLGKPYEGCYDAAQKKGGDDELSMREPLDQFDMLVVSLALLGRQDLREVERLDRQEIPSSLLHQNRSRLCQRER